MYKETMMQTAAGNVCFIDEVKPKGESTMETATATETMKVTVNRKDLMKALQAVKQVVPARPTLPALQNVLLDAGNTYLTITGTDLDLSMQVGVLLDPGAVMVGQCLVNHKKLLELVKTVKANFVTLGTVDGKLNIQAEGSGFCLTLDDLDNYPAVTFCTGGEVGNAELSEGTVAATKKAMRFVADKDRSRTALLGVYFELCGTGAAVTATNGHWLATFNTVGTAGGEYNFILPTAAVKIITGKHTEPWTVTIYDNRVTFRSGETLLLAKLIEGPYPNYKQVIPQGKLNHTFTVNRPELLQAINKLLPCSNEVTHQVKFQFLHNSDKPDKVLLSAENLDTGSSGNETVSGNLSGPDLTVAYNGQFVKDVLESIDSDVVHWATDGPVQAAVIRPVDTDEAGLYLLMPLRLND